MLERMQDDTDRELTRYDEAAQIKQYSGLSSGMIRGGIVQYDPIRKVNGVYINLPSGGKYRVGDRPVQVAQADTLTTQTDATAAAPAALVPTAAPAPVSLRPTAPAAAAAAAPQTIAEYDAQLRASSDRAPTAADFEAGGYTAEEFAKYQQSLSGPEMVPTKLTPAQVAEYAKQPGAQTVSAYEPPGFFDGAISETIKGLVKGGIVEPAKFVSQMLGETNRTFFQIVDPQTGEFDPQIRIVSPEEIANMEKMPFAPVALEELLKTDPQAGTGAQLAGGVGQFVGAFAGVGKLFKIGKGLLAATTQGAAADFLGFGPNDGRLTDVLLELGVPENRVTDFLRTDPNDPDYVGRFKTALEGAVLGGLVDQIAPVFRLLKDGGSATALGQAIGDLRFKAQQTSSNLLSDAIGVGRAVAAGDTRMLGEIFQPAGTPRSLGAAAPTGGPSAIIRPDDVFRGNGPITTSLDVATKPYAVRVTGQSQIDDMIQSGLIRPKEGGYGQEGKAILYFGEMDDAVPNSIFTRPKSDGDKNYTIVADSSKIAGREGPIPLDDVQHIWTMRDGQMVDVLGEVKLKNQEFGQGLGQTIAAGTPRSLGAAADGEKPTFTIAPPSETPGIAGLDPKYRVTVEGFTPEGTGKQSFIPQKMTPENRSVSDERLTVLAQEFPDPLASQEQYAGMMARARNAVEVPAPPTWMIEHANDVDKWAGWFKGLTTDQIKAADEGLAVQDKFRAAYADPTTGPELTGQLMFWSIMSRMLSAFPHESGFLELAQSADPYIRKALAGDWTDKTSAEWRDMVSSTIPLDSPGRSATSNANAFGDTFLRKMAVKDESGKSALERLHDMIADVNMSSAQIRRGYYGLANQTGIGNKILSFALLVSGRNDVVVLDRIQINRMWGGGEKIYDDIMMQFEGAQGLAQYEALERSLSSRVSDLYDKAGRPGQGSTGRYHWESWVLSSGQVVAHPTLESVVRAGTPNIARDIPPTASTPVMEGRFHTKYSGVKYEKTPSGGNRYVYSTSTGEPYQFTKAELDAMFDEAFKSKTGVLPPDFPGVKAFEGGNIPWFEYKGVDRAKLDDLIRSAGKPAEK